MKFLTILAALLFVSLTQAQIKSNAAIQQQLRSLGSDSSITVSYDAASNVTTLRAVSDNFSNDEAKRSGVRAVNFAAGAIYVGNGLEKSPEPILITFWVLSSKPRFAEDHSLTVFTVDETLQIGDSRYVSRARDGMEYLNFNLTRDQLKKIATQSSVKINLGRNEFNLTKFQLKLLADLYLATEVSK